MIFPLASAGATWTLAGYFVGALVLWWSARKRGLATEGMRLVALAGLAGGVFGARATQWLFAAAAGSAPSAWGSGKSLIGGLICGYLGVVWAKKRLGIARSTGDLWALAIPAGEAVGRIGCFFNGCCEGTRWNGAWSVVQDGAPRHPAQLYSSLSAAALFVLLCWLSPRLRREGDLFRVFLVLYGLSRFFIEFFRERPLLWRDWSLVQIVCLEIALSTAALWTWQNRAATRATSSP